MRASGVPMLQVTSEQPFAAIEAALRRAAKRNEASVPWSAHIGQHLTEGESGRDAFVFSICQAELYGALLNAEIRMAAFLPCRIAAYADGARVVLESVSPVEFCRILKRQDLTPLASNLEFLLLRIMEQAAHLEAGLAHAAAAPQHSGGLGATEDQMSARGPVPQRIDCRGTKIEDLAGTGEHDTKGG